MRLSLAEILAATGGTLTPTAMPDDLANVVVSSVTTDSRAVAPGALFVCLPGEKVDGHDFASRAVEQGASVVLAARDPFAGARPVPLVLVANPLEALGRLGAFWRDQTRATVIGITGTAGKTTIKEVLAQVLDGAGQGRVSRNRMNFNNQLGLPLSLLEAGQDDRFWVLEAGISQDGDMDDLGAILRPDLALVLNVGAGHTEGLGARGVAWHKARLFAYVRPGGPCLACADYPDLMAEARRCKVNLISFASEARNAAYTVRYIGPSGEGKGRFVLEVAEVAADFGFAGSSTLNRGHVARRFELVAPFPGGFGAENVAAIAAVVFALGLEPEVLIRGLATAVLPRQRFALEREGGWQVLDDSYNANPLSMNRMLEAAVEMAEGPLVCVLGEMRELGTVAAEEHRLLGQRLARTGVRAVFWKGGHFADLRAGLEQAGFTGPVCAIGDTASGESFMTAFAAHLPDLLPHGKGGLILFKGSRANKLEELVQAFRARLKDAHAV